MSNIEKVNDSSGDLQNETIISEPLKNENLYSGVASSVLQMETINTETIEVKNIDNDKTKDASELETVNFEGDEIKDVVDMISDASQLETVKVMDIIDVACNVSQSETLKTETAEVLDIIDMACTVSQSETLKTETAEIMDIIDVVCNVSQLETLKAETAEVQDNALALNVENIDMKSDSAKLETLISENIEDKYNANALNIDNIDVKYDIAKLETLISENIEDKDNANSLKVENIDMKSDIAKLETLISENIEDKALKRDQNLQKSKDNIKDKINHNKNEVQDKSVASSRTSRSYSQREERNRSQMRRNRSRDRRNTDVTFDRTNRNSDRRSRSRGRRNLDRTRSTERNNRNLERTRSTERNNRNMDIRSSRNWDTRSRRRSSSQHRRDIYRRSRSRERDKYRYSSQRLYSYRSSYKTSSYEKGYSHSKISRSRRLSPETKIYLSGDEWDIDDMEDDIIVVDELSEDDETKTENSQEDSEMVTQTNLMEDAQMETLNSETVEIQDVDKQIGIVVSSDVSQLETLKTGDAEIKNSDKNIKPDATLDVSQVTSLQIEKFETKDSKIENADVSDDLNTVAVENKILEKDVNLQISKDDMEIKLHINRTDNQDKKIESSTYSLPSLKRERISSRDRDRRIRNEGKSAGSMDRSELSNRSYSPTSRSWRRRSRSRPKRSRSRPRRSRSKDRYSYNSWRRSPCRSPYSKSSSYHERGHPHSRESFHSDNFSGDDWQVMDEIKDDDEIPFSLNLSEENELKTQDIKEIKKLSSEKDETTFKIDTRIKQSTKPLVGLSLILGIIQPFGEPMYRCLLCCLEHDSDTIIKHLLGYGHCSKYMEKFHPDVVRQLPEGRKLGYREFESVLKRSGDSYHMEKILHLENESEASEIAEKICREKKLPFPKFFDQDLSIKKKKENRHSLDISRKSHIRKDNYRKPDFNRETEEKPYFRKDVSDTSDSSEGKRSKNNKNNKKPSSWSNIDQTRPSHLVVVRSFRPPKKHPHNRQMPLPPFPQFPPPPCNAPPFLGNDFNMFPAPGFPPPRFPSPQFPPVQVLPPRFCPPPFPQEKPFFQNIPQHHYIPPSNNNPFPPPMDSNFPSSSEAPTLKSLSKLDEFFGFTEGCPQKRRPIQESYSPSKKIHINQDKNISPLEGGEEEEEEEEEESLQLKRENQNETSKVLDPDVNILNELTKSLIQKSTQLKEDKSNTVAATLLLLQGFLKSEIDSMNEKSQVSQETAVNSHHQRLERVQRQNPVMDSANQDTGLNFPRDNMREKSFVNEFNSQEILTKLGGLIKSNNENQLKPQTSESQNQLSVNNLLCIINSLKSGNLTDLYQEQQLGGMSDKSVQQKMMDIFKNSELNQSNSANHLIPFNKDQLLPFLLNPTTSIPSETFPNKNFRINNNQSPLDITSTIPSNFDVGQCDTFNAQQSNIYNSKPSNVYDFKQPSDMRILQPPSYSPQLNMDHPRQNEIIPPDMRILQPPLYPQQLNVRHSRPNEPGPSYFKSNSINDNTPFKTYRSPTNFTAPLNFFTGFGK